MEMQQLKSVNNYSYIHGDFDKDGTPNIDDKYPFDKKRKEPVNKEVSLDETFYYVEDKRKSAQKHLNKFIKKNPGATGRVKDTYSTINKAVRRNPFVSNDFIGIRIEGNKRKDTQQKWNAFNKVNKIPKRGVAFFEPIGQENKYRTNAKTGNKYRAFHSNFISGGFGVEAQFRTKKYGMLNDKMHTAYKKRQGLGRFRLPSKKLLRLGY
jgi:hypothetical protein